jgi:hypothetical protein
MEALIQIPAKCEALSFIRILKKKVNVQRKFTNKLLLDLAPSDFHLFLHLKKHLAGKKFDDDVEVQEEVMTWFKEQAAGFYVSGIQRLVPRLNKCLDNAGDYVKNKVMYRQFIHSVAFVN